MGGVTSGSLGELPRWARGLALLATLAIVAVAAQGSAQGAEPAEPELGSFCLSDPDVVSTAAGICNNPRGIGVDSSSGHVYVADSNNRRVQEFDAWGKFVRAWGWGVLDSSPELQTCTAGTGCEQGLEGAGPGQFSATHGIAVDNAGDVYVVDRQNHRVQKFHPPVDPEAPVEFVLMFGGDVNKTKVEEGGATEAERNRCTAASGHVCQVGTEGTGNGQFGNWPAGTFIAISSEPSEIVYVGDQGRIQQFDTDGNYLGDLLDPTGLLAVNTVRSLARDPNSGDVYVSFVNKGTTGGKANPPDVYRLDQTTGEVLDNLTVGIPTGLAVDTEGNVYVFDDDAPGNTSAPGNHVLRILQFDSEGNGPVVFDSGDGFSAPSTALATSSACDLPSPDLFLANPGGTNSSFVRIYGPPPNPEKCPPPEVPPTIEDQFALTVSSDGATVGAQINPHFWPTTTFWVEYGTGKCSEGGCPNKVPLPPGDSLTDEVKNAPLPTPGVFLDGLEPDTTYHFRFAARTVFQPPPASGEVVEVRGTGGEVGLDGGEDSFHTFPLPLPENTKCANQIFRGGLAARLPDCRGYELVSPLDKNNGDIETDRDYFFGLISPDGTRATYTSFRAFGEPQGAPLNHPYISERDPAAGWSAHSISPPRNSIAFYPPLSTPNNFQFKAFTEDLCEGWLLQDSNVALVEGAPSGVANVYQREDRGCGAEGYRLLTPVPPPGFDFKEEVPESNYYPQVQGISADTGQTLLRVNAVLTSDACDTTPGAGKGLYQVYLHGPGDNDLQLVSVLPWKEPACVHSSAGTGQGEPGEFREDNVYHALSADASRVFWSASAEEDNEDVLPPFGEAKGGRANEQGPLYVRLNPSAPPSAQEFGSAVGSGTVKAGSKIVSALSTASGAFVVGQRIAGKGIPAGTTITAVGASSLTLSLAGTQEHVGTSLGAWSTCTEKAEKACTVPISEAGSTRFWGADPAGNTAVFTAGGGLFEFDVDDETSTTIAATGVQGVMGMSNDASRIYFVSASVLTGETTNSEGAKAIAGQPNLYLHERGGGLTFVGMLSSRDVVTAVSINSRLAAIAPLPRWRAARVSGDGLHAAFTSAGTLTDYDNADASTGEPDAEVYLYDAESGGAGELTCVSCNPSGARPHGRAVGSSSSPIRHAARIPGWPYQLYASRALSADGNRLFFESFDALVLRDNNGKADVYEWERAGSEAECEAVGAELFVEKAGGCISLITSGKSAEDSIFLDASEGGNDVLFSTAGSLLPQDFGLVDAYNARVGGGFPPPEEPPLPCEGEACQPYSPPPEGQTPASSTFEGQGNVVPGPARRRCGKGKRRVVRGGKARCVKKQRQNGKRAKRTSGRAAR